MSNKPGKPRVCKYRRIAPSVRASIALAAISAYLSAPLTANAGMVELTVKNRPIQQVETPGKLDRSYTGTVTSPNKANRGDPDKRMKFCSANYNSALRTIRANEWEKLNNAYKNARKKDPGLPGKLLLLQTRDDRPLQVRKLVQQAGAIAKSRGRDPWIFTRSASWVVRQLKNDLNTYLTQGDYKYLCSGAASFFSFLIPHARKIEKRVTANRQQAAEFNRTASQSMQDALDALKIDPVATPGQKLEALSQNNSRPNGNIGLRSSLPSGAGDMLDTVVTNAIAPSENAAIRWNLLEDATKLALMQSLYEGAIKQQIISSDLPVVFSRMDVQKALASWKLILSSPARDAGTSEISNSGSPSLKRLKLALSDLETLFYLQMATNRLDTLNQAFKNSFTAIKLAHGANCTCSGITPIQ